MFVVAAVGFVVVGVAYFVVVVGVDFVVVGVAYFLEVFLMLILLYFSLIILNILFLNNLRATSYLFQ
ncbi:hypothetical protein EBY67_01765 [bacterium]|nr:hypothetical protein [bacterium]